MSHVRVEGTYYMYMYVMYVYVYVCHVLCEASCVLHCMYMYVVCMYMYNIYYM
jgi:hypothetical protein